MAIFPNEETKNDRSEPPARVEWFNQSQQKGCIVQLHEHSYCEQTEGEQSIVDGDLVPPCGCTPLCKSLALSEGSGNNNFDRVPC